METAEDGLPLARRRWIVAIVSVTSVLSVLDGTISNVALPTMARDFDVSSSDVIWVVNVFQLVTTMLLVPLSALGDIIGFRRIYLVGVVVFTAASALCATSHSLPELVAARGVQGIGAAAILSSGQPLARFAYPTRLLGVALGVQTLVVSIAMAAGPSIGGLILGIGSWPWMYWINLPFGVLVLAFGWILPATSRSPHHFDWASAVLSGATLVLLITGIDQLRVPHRLGVSVAELAAAAVVGTVLVRRQATLDVPMLAVDLLRLRVVWLSLLAATFAFISSSMLMVALPFFFEALGNTPSRTGLLLSSFAVGSALVAAFSGWLSDRFNTAALSIAGLAIYAADVFLIALLPDRASAGAIVARVVPAGIGYGLFLTPNIRAIFGAVPRTRTGAATGLTTSMRMTSATTGAALAALLFSFGASSGPPGTVALATTRLVLYAAGALALVALAVASLRVEVGSPSRDQPITGP